MKKCSRCHVVDPPRGFSKDKKKPDGLNIYCRDCTDGYNRGAENWKGWHSRTRGDRRAKRKCRIYRIKMQQYRALFARAEGKCECCNDLATRLEIDHNHVTGAVRGLVCRKCNYMIACLEQLVKDLGRAVKAHAFVENPPGIPK